MNFWEWIDQNWKKLLIIIAIIIGIAILIKIIFTGIALNMISNITSEWFNMIKDGIQ